MALCLTRDVGAMKRRSNIEGYTSLKAAANDRMTDMFGGATPERSSYLNLLAYVSRREIREVFLALQV